MDVLTTEFKKKLGRQRGVYVISTGYYASAFGIFKVGMAAEKSFNHRFSTFKYAGYGAIDKILCFGLICVSHDTMGKNHNKSTTCHGLAQVCRRIEQDVLQRLDHFRLRYTDTGRKSEWLRVDLRLVLGMLESYHGLVSMVGPTRCVATRCYGISLSEDDAKCDKGHKGEVVMDG